MNTKTKAYKLLLFLIIICVQNGLQAQQRIVIPVKGGSTSDVKPQEKSFTFEPISTSRMLYNVTAPSLEIFEPTGSEIKDIAVLVIPGGAFQILAYEDEGVKIAKTFAERGYTAAALKYRLVQLEDENPMEQLMRNIKDFATLEEIMAPMVPLAIADGKEAMKYLKANASVLGFDADKVGVIGFSAGGTISAAIALDKEVDPLFSALIYPYLNPVLEAEVPASPSPLFIAVTQDDEYSFDINSLKLYERWKSKNGLVDLRVFSRGQHGFASKKQDLPVDHWLDSVFEWLSFLRY
ncbi:alpha/beta hydrolase [Sphingobacterium paludis]|uniref:Dienelactone hydrolase family protein n=1 Tax=Sphingobacterium paludis TaxID=1476465 RepID=A0A4R7CZX4_9SPHI|nr:alpha/beta hydrolase [Sphingobacterium paludis]TDS13960.1 dienelactone hydrolase family protein [Sphingobacterium paludis]